MYPGLLDPEVEGTTIFPKCYRTSRPRTEHHILEASTLQLHRCENHKFRNSTLPVLINATGLLYKSSFFKSNFVISYSSAL
jgi:hypothetical protein